MLPLTLIVAAAAITIPAVAIVRNEPSRAACDKVASPRGSVGKLANSLRPGQTLCLRAGLYRHNVKVKRGGRPGAPTTIRSFPGERATVRGRLYVTNSANHVVVRRLFLDGRNRARLPSPTVNGNNVVFRDNDVTTRHTTICFLLGSDEYGRARRTVIERNRIHDCGELPPTNHHHGIYVEASDGARITDNWIYDNADRGVQLFPDAQRTYVARNVIDGILARQRQIKNFSSRYENTPFIRSFATTSRTSSSTAPATSRGATACGARVMPATRRSHRRSRSRYRRTS